MMAKLFDDHLSMLLCFIRECQAEVMCTKFSQSGSIFAVGLSNGVIKVSHNLLLKIKFW